MNAESIFEVNNTHIMHQEKKIKENKPKIESEDEITHVTLLPCTVSQDLPSGYPSASFGCPGPEQDSGPDSKVLRGVSIYGPIEPLKELHRASRVLSSPLQFSTLRGTRSVDARRLGGSVVLWLSGHDLRAILDHV